MKLMENDYADLRKFRGECSPTTYIATLVVRRARWLWVAQAALVLAYTAIITAWLPEQWLHPFGSVVKNLPILAALALLYGTEER